MISPPQSLTIEIVANPRGIQQFYVITRSSTPGFHGRSVKVIDKRLVPVNQKTNIPLNMQTQWFGLISTKIYHPEYFWETKTTNNKYIFPKSKHTPAAWIDALSNSPRWVTTSISLDQSPEAYEAAKRRLGAEFNSHQAIHLSHAHFHLSTMNSDYLGALARASTEDKVQASVEVLDFIVEKIDAGILDDRLTAMSSPEHKQQQQQKTEIQASLKEIKAKFN